MKFDQSEAEAVLQLARLGVMSEDGRVLTPDGKDALAVALGRRGGLKGGRARAAKLSSEERQKIARQAALVRWGKDSGRRS